MFQARRGGNLQQTLKGGSFCVTEGWALHYAIGIAFAALLMLAAGAR